MYKIFQDEQFLYKWDSEESQMTYFKSVSQGIQIWNNWFVDMLN